MVAEHTTRPYGRMRIRYDQAQLFYRLLWEERGEATRDRAMAKERGLPQPTITGFNQYIALLDATKAELMRLIVEQGWTVPRGYEDTPGN